MTAGTVRREEVDDHSSPLPSRLRDAAIALAVGHAPFASRLYGFDEYYLMAGRAGYIASLLDVAALAVLADALLRLARAAPSPVVRKGSQALFLVLALVALDRLRSQVLPIFHGRIALHWLYGWHLLAVKLFAIALVGAGVMVLLLRPRTRRLLVLAVEVALSLTVPFALWNVATLLGRIYADAQGVPPQSFAVAPQGSPTLASRRRIVLVIFDMFDYGAAFERRPASLRLPELDALRRNSLFGTEAFPPSMSTTAALPALTTGRDVARALPLPGSRLRLVFTDSVKQDWGAQPTIFSEARQLGAAIDIVGWHLPYCAIFGLLLHRCWTGSDLRSLPMPVRMLWEMDVALGLTPSDRILRLYASGHLALVEGQIAELHRAIEDTAADLVFLHLAIPHFPWIYDRQRGAFSTDRLTEPNGYPDNLALADAVLGDIVRAVERSPRADSTVLMVTGDHPYHVPPAYGQRDSLVPDPRVPFLVRLPGQHRTLTFGARIETIVTPGLALALLADSIRGPDDLARWLSVHSAEAQP